jgi:hypothetical protein
MFHTFFRSEGRAGQRSLRMQREVNDSRRADGSLTGVVQSALESKGKRGCGECPIKYSVRWVYRRVNVNDFGDILGIFWMV